jgi:hypothetical protein
MWWKVKQLNQINISTTTISKIVLWAAPRLKPYSMKPITNSRTWHFFCTLPKRHFPRHSAVVSGKILLTTGASSVVMGDMKGGGCSLGILVIENWLQQISVTVTETLME